MGHSLALPSPRKTDPLAIWKCEEIGWTCDGWPGLVAACPGQLRRKVISKIHLAFPVGGLTCDMKTVSLSGLPQG